MCLELVGRAIDDERYPAPPADPGSVLDADRGELEAARSAPLWPVDLRFDGNGPAKLLEYNADTPTSLFEAAVFQWTWLEQASERQIIPTRRRSVQFAARAADRSLAQSRRGRHLHLAGILSNVEDAGTLQYLEDVARQAGLATTHARYRADWPARRRRLRRHGRPRHRVRLQALPVGVDVPRGVRRTAERLVDALDRAAVEGDPVQQGHPAAAVGDVSEPSEPAAGLFRG